jgi:hypothetical protein
MLFLAADNGVAFGVETGGHGGHLYTAISSPRRKHSVVMLYEKLPCPREVHRRKFSHNLSSLLTAAALRTAGIIDKVEYPVLILQALGLISRCNSSLQKSSRCLTDSDASPINGDRYRLNCDDDDSNNETPGAIASLSLDGGFAPAWHGFAASYL